MRRRRGDKEATRADDLLDLADASDTPSRRKKKKTREPKPNSTFRVISHRQGHHAGEVLHFSSFFFFFCCCYFCFFRGKRAPFQTLLSLSLSHSLSDFASRLTPLLLFTVCVCFIQTTRLASRTSSLSSRSCRIAPSLHARKLVVTQGKRQLVWV